MADAEITGSPSALVNNQSRRASRFHNGVIQYLPHEIFALLMGLLTLGWVNADQFRFGDLLLFFLPDLFLICVFATVVSVLAGRRSAAMAWLALTVFNFIPLLPSSSVAASHANGPELRVATSNVLGGRKDYHTLEDWSTKSGIDLLGQQEVDSVELAKFSGLKTHFIAGPGPELGHDPDVVAWSNWKVLKVEQVSNTGPDPLLHWGGSALRLELLAPGGPADAERPSLVAYVLHPSTPRSGIQWRYRNSYLETVSRSIRAESPGTPVLAMGDFNTPPWSPFFRRFLDETGLVDASGTNWPTVTRYFKEYKGPYFFGSPIDHILVSKSIQVRGFKVGPDIGSDHLPVMAHLRLP